MKRRIQTAWMSLCVTERAVVIVSTVWTLTFLVVPK